jgi:hypothetical protein
MNYLNEMRSLVNTWDSGVSVWVPRFYRGDDEVVQHQWITAWMMEHIRLYISDQPEFPYISPEEFRRYQSAAYDVLVQKYGQMIQYKSQEDFNYVESLVGFFSKKLFTEGTIKAADLVEVTNPLVAK